MTKKDFIALADIIRANRTQFSDEAIQTLSVFCARQNVNFMRNRWVSYIEGTCGPNGGKRDQFIPPHIDGGYQSTLDNRDTV